ncbi:MAG: hypothetical protein H6571_17970 [Lewinellaceae bacterium]|nr:hypothetical protein [Bacteroidota bacterium]MCB9325631.1 hypothetical protein [Lewinellaceae bacterium]
MRKVLRYLSAIILVGFGLLTLFLSTSIIFDLFGIRAKEGNYVLFVVWSNFVSSILYLCSAYGFLKFKSWTTIILSVASVILIISFVSLKIHISNGGIYETKTVGAMIFRISLTIAFTLIAYFTITNNKDNELKK